MDLCVISATPPPLFEEVRFVIKGWKILLKDNSLSDMFCSVNQVSVINIIFKLFWKEERKRSFNLFFKDLALYNPNLTGLNAFLLGLFGMGFWVIWDGGLSLWVCTRFGLFCLGLESGKGPSFPSSCLIDGCQLNLPCADSVHSFLFVFVQVSTKGGRSAD